MAHAVLGHLLRRPAHPAGGDERGDLAGDRLTVSHWTRVEVSSLLARDVRMRRLDAKLAGQADDRFETMIIDSFVVVLPDAKDFDLAKAYFGNYESGLRAGDALHLATARNHGADTIFSLDQRLIRAGNVLGLPVSTGIRRPGLGD